MQRLLPYDLGLDVSMPQSTSPSRQTPLAKSSTNPTQQTNPPCNPTGIPANIPNKRDGLQTAECTNNQMRPNHGSHKTILDNAVKELLDICEEYSKELNSAIEKRQFATQPDQVVESDLISRHESNGCPSRSKMSNLEICKEPEMTAARSSNQQPNIICDKNSDQAITLPTDQQSSEATAQVSTTSTLSHNETKFSPSSSSSTAQNRRPEGADFTRSNHDAIAKLQDRQTELQNELDQVLQNAQSLEKRQRLRIKTILENHEWGSSTRPKTSDLSLDEDDEQELIEFQQIENELRISELNRQLDNIQEELRIRLYKQLLTNTTKDSQTKARRDVNRHPCTDVVERKNSLNSDENSSSPNLHSVDDVTSSTNTPTSISTNPCSPPSNFEFCKGSLTDNNLTEEEGVSLTTTSKTRLSANYDQSEGLRTTTDALESSTRLLGAGNGQRLRYKLQSHIKQLRQDEQLNERVTSPNIAKASSLVDSNLDSAHNGRRSPQTPTSTTPSRECLEHSATQKAACLSIETTTTSTFPKPLPQSNSHLGVSSSTFASLSSPVCLRNSSVNSDLERIEEDEEDGQDLYADSNHFRAVYEQKLSPIVKASANYHGTSNGIDSVRGMVNDSCVAIDHLNSQLSADNDLKSLGNRPLPTPNVDLTPTTPSIGDRPAATGTHTNPSIHKNRPLTLYLPKNDEEIDLIEHIQALGHDFDIVADDIKIDSFRAHGYLWKSCSNNSRKWLKRYFCFDRRAKSLSYYDKEAELLKDSKRQDKLPKRVVPFDEITDVYVDHKLSVSRAASGVKSKGGTGVSSSRSTKTSNVFVLATLTRKYLLATARAETMRAWIDILFTAAKSGDYFDEEDDNNQESVGGGSFIATSTNGSTCTR